MPTLQQLRYLVAVADTLHFRRAAERCNVTQPTLSGQIRELEERLGTQLIERSRSKVILTPIGIEVTARARSILKDMLGLIDLAKYDKNILGGTIKVGILHSLGPYLLPHILPTLHQSHPALKLYVREGMPQTLLHQLEEGRLDLLIFPLPVVGSDILTVKLFREPLWIVAPREHPLGQREKVERSNLKGQTVLALEKGHRLHDQVKNLCEQFGAELSLDFDGTSLDTLRQMVGLGMGISFLPWFYIDAQVMNDKEVIAREMKHRAPYRTIGMVWRKHSARRNDFTELARIFRETLRADVPQVMVLD
ncbi:MAG: LysR substrate-binding domain-containing protein [Pseudomonadota bacterium]